MVYNVNMKKCDVIRSRIRVSLAAFAYEMYDKSLISDSEYDKLSKIVYANRHIKTGDSRLDIFFSGEVSPDTGMWVRKHPELAKLESLYKRLYCGERV